MKGRGVKFESHPDNFLYCNKVLNYLKKKTNKVLGHQIIIRVIIDSIIIIIDQIIIIIIKCHCVMVELYCLCGLFRLI